MIESLAQAVTILQLQMSEAHLKISVQQNLLNNAAQKMFDFKIELSLGRISTGKLLVKKQVGMPLRRAKQGRSAKKGSTRSCYVQMKNYLGEAYGQATMTILLSALSENGHEC